MLGLLQPPFIDAARPHDLGLENVGARGHGSRGFIVVVCADGGVLLLEVNVDCDWSDVVERVFLVERQAETSLVL